MLQIMNNNVHDDIGEMIENHAGSSSPVSLMDIEQAARTMASLAEEEMAGNPWTKRHETLESYPLDVTRDGSETYFKALTDAIKAITVGDYGSIDYRGYAIYYSDTPHVRSISLKDGQREYSHHVGFRCDALITECYEEYHSEEERKAYLDPENDLFEKTLALLDEEIKLLDEGKWLKEKKKMDIRDFKDPYSSERWFKRIEWDDRTKEAEDTFSFLLEDALMRARGTAFTENDRDIFTDVIRRMVFFADYGKRNYLFGLQGLIWFEWKPTAKRDCYIWRCMYEFGQGDLPDRLLDNCAIYYFLDDPKGWEALAYLLPITALTEMCHDYEPDDVKNLMLKVFDLVPDEGYREQIEKLIEKDREKAELGGLEYDRKDSGSGT